MIKAQSTYKKAAAINFENIMIGFENEGLKDNTDEEPKSSVCQQQAEDKDDSQRPSTSTGLPDLKSDTNFKGQTTELYHHMQRLQVDDSRNQHNAVQTENTQMQKEEADRSMIIG